MDAIKHNLRRTFYHIRHNYLTLNNAVIVVGFFIALSWAWGSIEAMQRNYKLQQEVHLKEQQLEIEKLQVALLEYESRYYNSAEYQDVTMRQRTGKGTPGEHQLIVPLTDVDAPAEAPNLKTAPATSESNFQQWLNFLLGARAKK